ncbi:ExeM/NucH family extracellular endonuclease [Pseudocolwellia agarivorans]|uniref:ExeM/NucH family extracellular endonuclease n=1 Tax=Pseudocolwellia agarivorans TaxID=1911682 RepID=UPI0009852A2D|nr:ExeM/NucH family extracellular endonuclease [Pseudocolwellia agarivorans]
MFKKKTVKVDSLVPRSAQFTYTKSQLALCISSALLISTSAYAEDLWSENFNDPQLNNKGAVNSTIDMANVDRWSIDVSNASLTASSDWFKVTNAVMEARDVDGVVQWMSESIDISNKSDIKLSLLAAEQGTHEADDYFDLFYSVDGGAFVQVPNWQGLGSTEHTLIDDFTSTTIEADIAEGSTLVIKVAMQNGAGSEYLRLDDVLVTAGAATGDNGGDNGEGGETPETDTITDACFNCPDLTKIANAANFNDNDYYAQVFDAVNSAQSQSIIKESISNTISENHKQLTYSEVWTALTQTDEDPLNNNNVILFYRGLSLAKSSNGSGAQSSNQDNWNREHVWAKSHGFPSSSAHAYTDIHHLRPTDISVNSSRGNLDFDYSDSPLAESPANRVDSDSFEPRDAVKGDVARIIFYMDTRYAGNDSSTPDLEVVNRLTSTGEAKLGKLCALLSWNENDPVDEFEQKRNNRIYEFQGNRNPFIDHPEWISLIYTQSCTGQQPTDPTPTDPEPTDPEPTDPEPTDPTPAPGGADLFISEYVEGSSFNKAVEIYNPTLGTIDLTGYEFKLYSNGSLSPTSTLSLSGQLLSNNVLVLGNSQASGDIVSKIDVFTGAANFNGDDYIELTNGNTIIDSVGFYGVKQSWGSNKTLIRKASITQGDSNRTDAFDVAAEWDAEPSNTFSFLGSHNANAGTPTDPGTPTEPTLPIGSCNDSADYIHTIQGSGTESLVIGETKTIEGVVTSTVASINGYFVQEELTDQDLSDETSEGLFVFDENLATTGMPAIGHKVRVQGVVKEAFNRTQLTASTAYVDCGVGEIIAPQDISLPVDNISDWESVEGMLINVTHNLQVSDSYNLTRFGELSLSNGRLLKATNVYAPNSPQAIALTERNSRNTILLDDKNSQQNPEVVSFPAPSLSYINTVRLGDSISNLTGIVDFSFGNYRVLPTNEPQFISTNSRTNEPQFSNEGSLKIASFNVLNYFNGDGLGGGFPTARGAHTAEEFSRQSDKIVSALVAINADIVGLMEIENDGYNTTSAISDLVNKLNVQMGADTYRFVNPNSSTLGSDAITVGLIYKPASVALEGNAVTTTQTPFDFGNRQPLVQTFKEIATNEGITVAVNHFKSKGSCGSASGNNADINDGQGCWNGLRTQAANSLTAWLDTLPTGTTDTDVLIMGDLNAYAKEDPITAIEANGYQNLVEKSLGHNGYSYSFGGELGYLDHALASSSLTSQVVETTVWHINADEPRSFDYNTEFKSANQLNTYYGSDAYRASDHDPVVISLNLASASSLLGDFDSDGDVDRNDLTAFTLLLRRGETLDIKNDFNNDGAVNTRDVRSLMSLCTRSRCAAEQ